MSGIITGMIGCCANLIESRTGIGIGGHISRLLTGDRYGILNMIFGE
jgi:hypothetical protein